MLDKPLIRVLLSSLVLIGLLVFSSVLTPFFAHADGADPAFGQFAPSPTKRPCPPPAPPDVPVPPGCPKQKPTKTPVATKQATRTRTSVPPNNHPTSSAETPVPSDHSSRRSAVASPYDMCTRLTVNLATTIRAAEIATYQVVAHNNDQHDARGVQISFPILPTLQSLVDVTFTRPNAWVSAVLTDAVELHLGMLTHNETVTATIRLRTSPDAPLNSTVTTQSRISWDGRGEARPALSNRVSLTVASTETTSGTPSLDIAHIDGSPQMVSVSYDGFASNEQIGLWYNGADGSVKSLGDTRADSQGQMTLILATNTLPPGSSTFVARGACSQVVVTGRLVLDQQ